MNRMTREEQQLIRSLREQVARGDFSEGLDRLSVVEEAGVIAAIAGAAITAINRRANDRDVVALAVAAILEEFVG